MEIIANPVIQTTTEVEAPIPQPREAEHDALPVAVPEETIPVSLAEGAPASVQEQEWLTVAAHVQATGDRQALWHLFAQYYPTLLKFAFHYIGSRRGTARREAEDFVQAAGVKVATRFDTCETTHQNDTSENRPDRPSYPLPELPLFMIAVKNLIRDHFNRHAAVSREVRSVDVAPNGDTRDVWESIFEGRPATSPEDVTIATSEREVLAGALQAILRTVKDPNVRQIIFEYLDGAPSAELAAKYNRSEGSIKQLVVRLRERARRMLLEGEVELPPGFLTGVKTRRKSS